MLIPKRKAITDVYAAHTISVAPFYLLLLLFCCFCFLNKLSHPPSHRLSLCLELVILVWNCVYHEGGRVALMSLVLTILIAGRELFMGGSHGAVRLV